MKIKILHITKMKGVSGSENHLLTLLAGLDTQRFDVHFYILAEARHLFLLEEYKKRLEQHGVVTSFLVMRRHGCWSLLWKLRALIRQGNFDIVHTHLIHADFYGTLAAKLAGVSVIVSSRHNDDRFRRSTPLIWLNRFLAHWHNRVIVISDWVGKFLLEVEGIPADKIVRIHYGLEPDNIRQYADREYVRQQFGIPEGTPVIGTVGRLTAQKGQMYLLQAIAKITPAFPDLRVLVVGNGELLAELGQQAKALGITANVIFTGYRNDAIKLLSGFDFFVFPSLWEGFGLVLLEAMALEKAIVASHVSAIPESVLHERTGLLVPPKNDEKLAEAMLMLLHNKALQRTMGENGYKRLMEDFTVRRMVERTEELYLSLLSTSDNRENT